MPEGLAVGDFVLHRRARRLLDAHGRVVRLGGRAMGLLIALAERAGTVVGRDELMALAWPGRVIEESTLRVHMVSLRKALGDSQQDARYIATIPGRGYCLVARTAAALAASAGGPQEPASSGDAPCFSLTHARLPPSPLGPPMIGRAQALAHLVETARAHRLTSVVAAGGVGKTTLALAAAREAVDFFEHGACFIDLSGITGPMVSEAVARSLGLPGEIAEPRVLAKALADRHLLLMLDNCEHVLDAAARLVQCLIHHTGRVHVLATSREPLGLVDEQLRWLPGLAWPAAAAHLDTHLDIEQADGFGALHLLAEQVRACDGGVFRLSAANRDDAVALCQRLDGVPLAIELVASRVASLGLKPVLDSLDDALLRLRHPRRTVPARHQTLGATLDWSHALLDDTERAVLRCCGLFESAFTLDAAKDLLIEARLDVLEAVGCLVDLLGKCLIQPAPEAGPGCFRLQEATRRFARLQLDATGDGAVLWSAHQRQLHHWITQARDDDALLSEAGWMGRHGWIGPELRAAIERALSRPDGAATAIGLLRESVGFARRLLPPDVLAGLAGQVRHHAQGEASPPCRRDGREQALGAALPVPGAMQAA